MDWLILFMNMRREASLAAYKNRISIPLCTFCYTTFRLPYSYDRRAPTMAKAVSLKSSLISQSSKGLGEFGF